MSWYRASESGKIVEDEVTRARVENLDIALYRLDGKVYATANVCTHEHAFMSDGFVDGNCIECPLHQGRFDIATGKGQGAPIRVDLKTYAAKEEDGWAFVDIP